MAGSVVLLLLSTVGMLAGPSTAQSTSASGSIILITNLSIQPSSATVFEGQDVVFTCTYSESVTATVTWLRDGQELVGVQLSDLPNGGRVTLQRVVREWNGSEISCVVDASGGNTASASASLTVLDGTPRIHTPPANVTVLLGQPFSLTCVVTGYPPPSITWNLNMALFNPNFFTGVSYSSELGLLQFTGAKEDFLGEYTCEARNEHGTVTSEPASVRVQFAPKFIHTPEAVDVENGSTVVLSCGARGYPSPTIHWTHNDEPVVSGSRVVVTAEGDLRISDLKLMDAGAYTCSAVNEIGSISSDPAVLMVWVRPVLVVIPEDTTSDLGQSARIRCLAFGLPAPNYAWLHNGELVEVEKRVRVSVVDGSLFISEVRREDAGSYVCIAENAWDQTMSLPVQLTVYAPPSKPESVEVLESGPAWLQLKWSPIASAQPAVLRFLVEYRLSFHSNWTLASQTTMLKYNITQLYPDALYYLRVKGESPKGVGEASEPVSSMTLFGVPPPTLPASPVNISVTSSTSHSITLHWDIPPIIYQTSYNGTHVRIMLPLGHERELLVAGSSVTVSGLEPATMYAFQLAIVFTGGFVGMETGASGTTLEDVPGDAPFLMVTAFTATTLTLSWSPPSQPNGHITQYTIRYNPVASVDMMTLVATGDKRSMELEGLHPYTNYSILFSASTAVGEGPSSRLVAATGEDVPRVAPTITIQSLNSTAIQLSWEPLEEGNVPGVLTQYTILYNPEDCDDQKSINVTVEMGDTSLVIHGLNPFTVYHVMVAGATNAGVGMFSAAYAKTAGDVPGAVVNITSIVVGGPTSLTVEWAKPTSLLHADPANISYVIRYQPVDGSENLTDVPVPGGNSTVFNLTGLMPYTTYSVAMAVENLYGIGNFGESVNATTAEGVPTVAPSGLTVVPLSSTSLKVSWQPLAEGEVPGILINYTIKYNQYHHGGHPVEVKVHANRTEYILEGLQKYTVYKVCVAGETIAGVGNFSAVVENRTLADIPDVQLTAVSLIPFCPPSSFIISWVEPDEGMFRKQLNGPEESALYVFNVSSLGEEWNVTTVSRSELGGSTSYNLIGLAHNTSYTVTMAVGNSVGVGNSSEPAENSTLQEGVPSAPRNLTLTSTSANNITVMWSPPILPRGSPLYTVRYQEVGEEGGGLEWKWADVNDGEITTELFGLKPFTNYTVEVRAETNCGQGEPTQSSGVTMEAPPSPPVGVAIILATPSSLIVQWGDSMQPNGIILEYKVYCPASPTQSVTAAESGLYMDTCTGLDVDTSYTVGVAAVNGAGEGEMASTVGMTVCEGLTPEVQAVGGNTFVRVTSACSVQLSYILVVVQELVTLPGGNHVPPSMSLGSYSLEELIEMTDNYPSKRSVRQVGQERVYIAANVSSENLEGTGLQLGDNMMYGDYQNHELKEGVAYNIGLRGNVAGSDGAVFTATTEPYTVSAPPEEDDSSDDFPLIYVVVGAAGGTLLVVIVLIVVCVCCCCCCCFRSMSKNGGGAPPLERGPSIRISRRGRAVDPVDEFRHTHGTDAMDAHPPVPMCGFVNKLLVMRTNDNQLFLEEFGTIEMNPRFPTDVANHPHNQAKNRYNNILPYDHSRVKISHARGHHGSDYINANYVSGYMKPKTYIATQGPLPETVSDFWRMVWEENSRSIVMLTNPKERGKTKCEVYWPREVGSSGVYGHIEVTLKYYTHLADYTIRTFSVQKIGSGKDSREVRQFHFTSWPDHGVPQYATAMLSLMRHVRAYHPRDCGPMVVHCSAGVGRSGTFIVLDTMLDRMRAGGETVDIYGHVTLLRAQRNYMVQTEDQYFFIHEAVAEAVVCGDTEVAMEDLPEYASELCQVIPEDEQDTTYIELEFKRLAVDKNEHHRFASASRDANKSKNRYVNVLPFETNRVCLEYMRGVDGSDYINASYIDSYHFQQAFIATQGPLQHTVADFWRMVWQSNTPVVVMLTQLIEKGMERSAQYWPHEVLRGEKYGNYTVEMTTERHSGHYVYRDLHITDPESGQKRQVRHYQFLSWPEVGVPASPQVFVEFLREVQKLYATLNTKAPIVVHCSNGVGRTGVFIALHIVLERMLTEGQVDVFQTVKNLRIQRPAMVQTLEQYQFCYDASVDYVHSSDLLLIHQQLRRQPTHRRTGSNTSDSRRKSRGNSPARSESFNRKRSSRNLELSQLGNGGSHIIRETDQTSTFGRQRNASPSGGSHSPSGSSVGVHSSPRVSALISGEGGSCSPRASTHGSQMGLLPSGTELSQLATHSWSHGAAAADTHLSYPSGSQFEET